MKLFYLHKPKTLKYNSFLYQSNKIICVILLFLIGNNKYPFLVDDQHCVMLQNNKLWEQQKSYPTTCSLHWFTGFLASNSGRERVCFRSIAFSRILQFIFDRYVHHWQRKIVLCVDWVCILPLLVITFWALAPITDADKLYLPIPAWYFGKWFFFFNRK